MVCSVSFCFIPVVFCASSNVVWDKRVVFFNNGPKRGESGESGSSLLYSYLISRASYRVNIKQFAMDVPSSSEADAPAFLSRQSPVLSLE